MKKEIVAGMFFVAIVLSNIVTNRLVMLGDLILPGAFVLYAVTFLCTDVLSELYGKKYAAKVVWIGFGFSVFGLAVITLVGLLPYPPFESETVDAYDLFFSTNARIVFGSMLAYLIAQHVDITIFHGLKKATGNRHKWIRNNVSTMVSQAVDTAIFILIAFAGSPGILAMIVSQYVVKLVVAVVDTPIFYAVTKRIK